MYKIYPKSLPDEGAHPIALGGTGARSADLAASNLGLVTESRVGVPEGLVVLDQSSLPPDMVLPEELQDPRDSSLNGVLQVLASSVNVITITDFDINKTYDIEAIAGSVSRSGATITYTAPSSGTEGGFIINGREIPMVVTGNQIGTALITSPTEGALNLSVNPTLTTSQFTVVSGSDTHLNTDWQVATDAGFTNIVAQSNNDTVNKTSWTVGVTLSLNTTYYARARHRGTAYGAGSWSPTRTFITRQYNYPALIVKEVNGVSGDINLDGTRAVVANVVSTTMSLSFFRREGNDWVAEGVQSWTSAESIVSYPRGKVHMSDNGDRAVYSNRIFRRDGTTWSLEHTLPTNMGSHNATYIIEAVSPNCEHIYGYGGDVIRLFSRSGTTWTEDTYNFDSPVDYTTADRQYSAQFSGSTLMIFGESGSGSSRRIKYFSGTRSGSNWAFTKTLDTDVTTWQINGARYSKSKTGNILASQNSYAIYNVTGGGWADAINDDALDISPSQLRAVTSFRNPKVFATVGPTEDSSMAMGYYRLTSGINAVKDLEVSLQDNSISLPSTSYTDAKYYVDLKLDTEGTVAMLAGGIKSGTRKVFFFH